jgi:hypothetical protein
MAPVFLSFKIVILWIGPQEENISSSWALLVEYSTF